MAVRIKRAYEPADSADGHRALVDRLWPRGVSKAEARLDEWAKDLAPSPELRLVYGARDTQHNGAVVLAELLRTSGAAEPAGRLGPRAHC